MSRNVCFKNCGIVISGNRSTSRNIFHFKKQKKAPHTEPFVYQKKNYLEDFFLVVLEAVLTKVFLTKAEALLASVLLEEVLLLEEMLLATLFKVAREVS